MKWKSWKKKKDNRFRWRLSVFVVNNLIWNNNIFFCTMNAFQWTQHSNCNCEWMKKIRFTCCITKQQPTRKLNEHVRLFYDIISIFSASDFLAWLTFLFIYFYLFICFHSFASVSCWVQLKSRVSCRRIIYNFTSPFSPYIFSYTQFNLSEFIHFINNIDQAKETEIVSEN